MATEQQTTPAFGLGSHEGTQERTRSFNKSTLALLLCQGNGLLPGQAQEERTRDRTKERKN